MNYAVSSRTWPILFYLGSILIANWLVIKFGLIHLGPLVFPAGAVAIGLTFSARDLVQVHWGKWGCWIWMGVAGIITATLNWHIALASCTPFIVAESADWVVYTLFPGSVRKRMLVSNLFGIPLDSIVFVSLVFGMNWPAVVGQTIVKLASGALVVMLTRREDVSDALRL